MKPTTGCVCGQSGWCERHKVMKGPHWHHLCQTSVKQWERWESGIGFGQAIAEKNAEAAARDCAKKLPSMARQAWNLTTSLASFVADGCRLIDKDEYGRRMAICDSCEMRDGGRCVVCGCHLAEKARGRAFQCPLGRWSTPKDRRWTAPIITELDRRWAEAYMAGNDDPEYTIPAPWRYVRTAELAEATVKLLPRLPRDIDGVAGIPRSGLIPASIIASHLHVPLYECGPQHGLRRIGNGIRGHTFRDDQAAGPLLIVDDTIYSGFAMRAARNILDGRKAYYAAIFVRPAKAVEVNFFSEILPSPHLLEWNLWSSGMTCGTAANPSFTGGLATDLDGVLCEDFLRDGDDTPEGDERYRLALIDSKPLVTAGLYPIPLIVTYRPERFRAETEDWLRRNRILWDKLVMHPAERFRDRNFVVPQLKIDAYAESTCSLFVESDSAQAFAIRQATGRPVLDMATGVIL